MIDVLLDTLLDLLKLVPFLFLAFLIIEVIEHKLTDKNKDIISKSGKIGPLIGSTLGLIPQCGFGVVATNLYVTRIISLGTLISIYLSTSDEMLPILLSTGENGKTICIILAIKFISGLIFGFLIDLIIRKKETHENYHICEEEHCDCEHSSILLSSIIHTLKTLIFIGVIIFALNTLFYYFEDNMLHNNIFNNSYLAPFITSLFGLIPSCGSSIVLTELLINKVLSISSCVAGLLTNSGVSLLILFKSNKNIKENIFIVSLLYSIGVIVGILLKVFGL